MDQCIAPTNPRRARRFAVALMVIIATFGGLLAAPAPHAGALPGRQDDDDLRCVAPEPGPFPVVAEAEDDPSGGSSESGADPDTGTADATPVASPVASPVAIPEGTTDESDEVIESVPGTDEIERVVRTIALCQTESRVKTFSRFVTEDFLGDVYAGGGAITRDQFVELAPDLPNVPVAIVSVSDVEIDAGGTATAEVVSTYGNQLLRARWSFVFVDEDGAPTGGEEDTDGVWWPDGVTPLTVEPPEGAREVEVDLDENAYDPDSLRVRGPDIVISARNRGDDDHELLVLSLRHDVTTRDLLTAPGPALPNGVTVIGQLTVPAGAEGELVLVDMERGEYVIVDLLPSADGTPHLALGMEATLTVR